MTGNGPDKEFKLACGEGPTDAKTFKPPDPWPTCKEPPPPATTLDPLNTTPEPLKPCQCIGDIPINQARNILDKFCRNASIEGNVWIFKAKHLGGGDYEGYTPPSRKRCGSRNPEDPELKDHCFCSGVEKQASKSIYLEFGRAQRTEMY